MSIFNKGSNNSVGSAIIWRDPVPRTYRTTETSRRTRAAYVSRRIKSNVFSLPLAFRAAMEGDGAAARNGGTREGKAASWESCEPMKMTMPCGHTSDVFHRLLLPRPTPAPRHPSPSAESEFRNNRTRRSEKEGERWSTVAVHIISGISGGEGVGRSSLREKRRGIIISRDEEGRRLPSMEKSRWSFSSAFFATLLLPDNETLYPWLRFVKSGTRLFANVSNMLLFVRDTRGMWYYITYLYAILW